MPQIAQQDYLRIVPAKGRGGIAQDAEAFVRMKQSLHRGTILDVAITTAFEEDTEDSGYIGRVIGYHGDTSVFVYDGFNNEIVTLLLPYSEAQYEGLSAVQLAEDAYLGETMTELPKIGRVNDVYLSETNKSMWICINDYILTVSMSGGKLTGLTISGEKVDPGNNWVNITWEDAQKLIGLPIQ